MRRALDETSIDTVAEKLLGRSGRRTSRLALERAAALVRSRMFGTQSRLLQLGRYQLVGVVGQGGMGIVYEAVARDRGARFALKVLREPDASLAALKLEFRDFSQLAHPNLVTLHELGLEGHEAFIAMEFIDGVDFVAHVRRAAPPGRAPRDEPRLRGALAQLCEGVSFLHQAGKLHRDIKPSNLWVTEQGRVVLLDFGLAQDAGANLGFRRASVIAGTPAYMAPEQAAGAAQFASDWFSVGVVLYEALTGRRPGASSARHDTWREPLRASLIASSAPLDLQELCLGLLHHSPDERLGAAAIRTPVRRGVSLPVGAQLRASMPVFGPCFVGRAAPLRRLREAFELSRTRSVLVLLRGEAGIGKTSLVRHTLARYGTSAGMTVLRGRCYERESVPYQGLDGVVEDLTRWLSAQPRDRLASVLPENAGALGRMFPSLASLYGPASFDALHSTMLDTFELRARGFFAFGELLANVAQMTRLVLWIDDAQWGDADAGQLLATLLSAQAPLLLIVSQRSGLAADNAMMRNLRGELVPGSTARIEVELGPLSRGEAIRLARRLLPAHRRSAGVAAKIASESAGQPLFIAELARFVLPGQAEPVVCASVEELVQWRFSELPRSDQRVLQLVAVAGRPTSRAVIVRAAGHSADAPLHRLCVARFVHTAGTQPDDVLQIEHDRVRDVLTSSMETGYRRGLHRTLAKALESGPDADPETLVEHYLEAGCRREAALHAVPAADAAAAQLAFERAARLYALALESSQAESAERGRLQLKLADALANSGHGDAAAALYMELAACSPERAVSADLRCRAAEHLMFNGRAEEAIALLRQAIEWVGLRWPSYDDRLLWLVVLLRGVLLMVLPRWLERRLPARRYSQQLDFLVSASRIIAQGDLLRASYFALGCMLASSRVAEPGARARGLSLRAAGLGAVPSRRCTRAALPYLAQACSLAEALESPLARARVENVVAHVHLQLGRFREARELAAQAEQRLRSVRPSLFDFFESLHVTGMALLALGELHELRARWSAYIPDQLLRGSPMSGVCIRGHGARIMSLLAADDLATARDIIAEQNQLLERFPRLGAVMLTRACAEIEYSLYLGDGTRARQLLAGCWSKLHMPNVLSASYAQGLRGRTALAAACSVQSGAERRRLVRSARAASRALRGLHRNYAEAPAELLLASAAKLSDEPERAVQHLQAAIRIYDDARMGLMAACARRALATFATAPCHAEQVKAADALLADRGVCQPIRWVASFAPGLVQH